MFSIISLLDDRARPKGSRDPLGVEAIWSYMGRKVVGNLTTITGNLDNFIVALLCCHHANENATEFEQIQDHFMCAEQLAAYLKLANGEGDFLGITRASKFFENEHQKLGKGEEAEILSNQLSYGLWGLYSSAIAGAGLISGVERKLTPSGRILVDAILGELGDEAWKNFQRLASRKTVSKSELEKLSPQFHQMLRAPALKQLVVNDLLAKQKSCVLQSELYAIANRYPEIGDGNISAQHFCAWLLASDDAGSGLKAAIERISDVEVLLILANTLMSWLQGQKNVPVAELHAVLQPLLKGLSCKESWLQEAGIPYRAFLGKLLAAINSGSAEQAIAVVLQQNKDVMQQRGGAAWVEIDGQQKLNVRVANDKAQLPPDLVSHTQTWQNSYFIGSFLNIIRQGESWKH